MDSRSSVSSSAYALHDKRFALLIDADNVSAKYLKPILDELSKYGTVTYKRIYGDWTLSLHAKWKSALLENSITPIQQFGYTQGKNATDSAMIIDAMDILYTNSVEGFCIVSSDSDFTRLAARIRESGLTVIGMGEKKTPVPFRTACDVFVTLELLTASGRRRGRAVNVDANDGESAGPTASKQEIEQAVVDIITDNTNNGKATGLGEIGSRLQKRYPDFDVRSYGTNLLSKLLSEFSSVHIAKAGSNVAVELADGASGVKSEDVPQKSNQLDEAALSISDESLEEAEASVEEEGDIHRTRRRRRGRRGGRKLKETVESEAVTAPEEETGRIRPEAPSVEEPNMVSVAENHHDELTTLKNVQHDDGENAIEQVADGLEELEEVENFIVTTVRERGNEGVAVGELGKITRKKFKTFRVTKTGFRNLRLYVASFEGVQIEKREDDRYAVWVH